MFRGFGHRGAADEVKETAHLVVSQGSDVLVLDGCLYHHLGGDYCTRRADPNGSPDGSSPS
jgi:hypothetical protein